MTSLMISKFLLLLLRVLTYVLPDITVPLKATHLLAKRTNKCAGELSSNFSRLIVTFYKVSLLPCLNFIAVSLKRTLD